MKNSNGMIGCSPSAKRIIRAIMVVFILMGTMVGSSVAGTRQVVQRNISGTVKDASGEAMIGATVHVKDAGNKGLGTVVNLEGKFDLNILEGAILIFSYLGYQTQEVKVTNQRELNIIMQPADTRLDEIVVVGYGTQKKANLTGAVSSVEVGDIEGRALTNADQVLQGKIPGVSIIQNSGQPGDEASEIRIRGVSSIDNNNDPLVIINGVEGNLNDISPNDIESISVLKDAASASIYGSRASAGVIIIETKKGQAGKGLQVEYNMTASLTHATRLPKTTDSYTYASLINEARENMKLPPVYTENQVELFRNQTDPRYPNTDWYDVYFRSGRMQNHYVSLRGGEKNYRFFASATYRDQKGILIGTSSDKLSYNSRLDGNFLDNRVRIGVSVSGYGEKSKELIAPSRNVMAELGSFLPTAYIQSVDSDTGEKNLYSYSSRFIGANDLGGGTKNDLTNLNLKGNLEIEPIKNLVAKVLWGRNEYRTDYVLFSPEFYTSGSYEEATISKRESMLEKRYSKSTHNTLFASLGYALKLQKHDLKLLLAHERLEIISNRDDGRVKDLSNNAPVYNYGDPNTAFLSTTAWETATLSYFGRLNYSYADKYLLEVNMRRDGSSRFMGSNKWGNFPSVSAGWRVSEEKFMKKISFLDLKLRASWGKLGNQNIYTQYAFADQMSGSEYYAFGNIVVPGRGTTVLANKDTRWETTNQVDIGLDASLWKRLNITVDYFRKKTYDILARVTIPPSLGVSALPYQNIGDMVNKGIEISVGYRSPARANKLNYSIDANISYIKNELTSLGGLDYIDHSTIARSIVGKPFSSFFGYKVEGIYQVSDFTWQNNSDEAIPHNERNYVLKEGLPDVSGIISDPAPGDIRIKDVDKSGTITADDKTVIGNSLPKLLYALTIDLSYKGFGLNIIGQGVGKVDAYMNGNLIAPFYNTVGPIRESMVKERWTYENPSNKYQRLYVDKVRDALVTSYNVYDASFFRLKSVQLSYTFDKKLTGKIGVKRCRVFVTGENLLLLTNFVEGFDPERKSSYVTVGFHPQIATYSVGLNLNF